MSQATKVVTQHAPSDVNVTAVAPGRVVPVPTPQRHQQPTLVFIALIALAFASGWLTRMAYDDSELAAAHDDVTRLLGELQQHDPNQSKWLNCVTHPPTCTEMCGSVPCATEGKGTTP